MYVQTNMLAVTSDSPHDMCFVVQSVQSAFQMGVACLDEMTAQGSAVLLTSNPTCCGERSGRLHIHM